LKYFSKFGEVIDSEILKDDGHSQRAAYVEFKDSFILEKVLDQVHDVDGKTVYSSIIHPLLFFFFFFFCLNLNF